jgi:hypothetical protein
MDGKPIGVEAYFCQDHLNEAERVFCGRYTRKSR